MAEPIASLDSVYFSYDRVHDVLEDINLELEAGRIYAFLGPNGAGKSTLVGLLTGLFEPTRGRTVLAGSSYGPERRRRSACVCQQLSVFPHLTVAENLALAADGTTPWKTWSRSAIAAFAHSHLSSIGIRLPVDTRCDSLSFPARQKLEIARALVRRPQVLFLDEPTSALDRGSRKELYSILRHVNAKGTTVVLVTHDPSEVEAMAANPVRLVDGRVVSDDAMETSAVACCESGIETARENLENCHDCHRLTSANSMDGPFVADTLTANHETTESQVKLEIVSQVQGVKVVVPLAPQCVSLLSFEDALERTESIAAITANSPNYQARLWIPEQHEWVSLPDKTLRGRIRVLSTDKQTEILFPSLSVLDNAVLLGSHAGPGSIRLPTMEHALLDRLRNMGAVKYPSDQGTIQTLSGGNQQRFVLAGLVEYSPDVLVMEEPLMGLDESSCNTISQLLADYVKAGGHLLIATCFPHHYEPLAAKATLVQASFAGSANEGLVNVRQ